MKTLLIYIISVILVAITWLAGNFILSSGEEKTIKWINEHQKPIVCRFHKQSMMVENSYTLIDAKGVVFTTGFIDMALPDTLK